MAYTNGFEQSIPHQQEKNLPGGGNWVVQKFGGTSVGKFAIDIANDIVMYADSLYTPCNPSTDPSPVLA
jgi:aspartate kinase